MMIDMINITLHKAANARERKRVDKMNEAFVRQVFSSLLWANIRSNVR